ncbi:MAG: EamA family transporter RarD [Woeseiaceae bacterium]|nr:EamA family transporter RarD [Woeseiaceae bacterium]
MSAITLTETPETRARNGVLAGLLAFGMWGFLPIYFKLLSHVPAVELLVHRVVWAVPFGALIIVARRQWPEVRRALVDMRTLGLLSLAAMFISINWLVYIWAVLNSQIFQASLGYYINPLMYVLVGVGFLGDRLRRPQLAAVVLAATGVAVLTVSGGQFPLISLVLAVSFTCYGVIRKQTNVGAMPGLFIETLLLAPLAAGYLLVLARAGESAFLAGSAGQDIALLLAGPITVLPLLCFALAARRVTLSTIGFMQFIAPTLQFAMGIVYGERLTLAHAICFGCIWIAVALFSYDAWRASRRARLTVPEPGYSLRGRSRTGSTWERARLVRFSPRRLLESNRRGREGSGGTMKIMHCRPAAIVLGSCLFAAGVAVGASVADALDPARVAPHIYAVKLENERVRVLDVTIRNGEMSPLAYAPGPPDRLPEFLRLAGNDGRRRAAHAVVHDR